ncbi:hypothetical protein [Eudoraea sp.]|uniref:hypothetical protein n=1 Tax=Eudoraea sp. TaxID=1979955 RepID=UPI003C7129E0
MPVLSNYWFEDPDFRGNTTFLSIQHPTGGWAWINWANIGSKDSTLVWEREDREIVIDLTPQVDTSRIRGLIDTMLGGSANRTSGISAGWIPWKYVPYYSSRPDRNDLDLLVRLFFNFHVDTPWYCTDANGNISYYLRFFLTVGGNLRASVDGWSFDYNGGGPFCTGEISNQLRRGIPGGMATLQTEIDNALAIFGGFRFDLVYLLPGSGDTTGSGAVDVNRRCSLALLPR